MLIQEHGRVVKYYWQSCIQSFTRSALFSANQKEDFHSRAIIDYNARNTYIPKLKHVVGVDTKVLDFWLVRRQEILFLET